MCDYALRRSLPQKAVLVLLLMASCAYGMRHISSAEIARNSHHRDDSYELDYDASDSDEALDDEYGTFTDERVKDLYRQQQQNYAKIPAAPPIKTEMFAAPPVATTASKPCTGSCLDRPSIETAALDSIKKHLLMRLGMERLPNITNAHRLPDIMLESLCLRNNMPAEYCTDYQSDQPSGFNVGPGAAAAVGEVVEVEEDVQFMSIENRIYAFPNAAVKHRHKSQLIFSFGENQESNNMVVHASLNLFVHSRKYLLANNVHDAVNLKYIDIEIAEVLSSEKHKMIYNVFHNLTVPEHDDGKYLQLNVTDLVAKWFQHHAASHGISVKITASDDGSRVPNKVVVLDADDLIKRPMIDILPKDQRKKRTKRSTLKCSKDSNENRCCRRSLTVDFEKFGWDWIIAPKRYNANYCAGECKVAFMQKYAHTHVVHLSTATTPCCSPRRMSPMQLLYFDTNLNIVLGTIPNMIVEECFCS